MRSAALVLAAALVWGCATQAPPPAPPPEPPAGPAPAPPPPPEARELEVSASAFNSVPEQTDAQPRLTASGERLRPGLRALAVSRDLERAGLVFGTTVEIEGYGEWVVLDRMAPRWRRKVDLYLGDDLAAAKRFGERTVTIRWRPKAAARSLQRRVQEASP
jgi:3D (Asp-Asp-Asp) domain-containing protein